MPMSEWDKSFHPAGFKKGFLFIWICGWGVPETFMIAGLFGQPMDWKGPPQVDWGFILFFCFWTVAGPVAFWHFLKMLRKQSS